MELSIEKEELLNQIIADLRRIENIEAVVLGGSYSTGNATEKSDIDIGLYYSENAPFNIDSIKQIANKYSIHKPTVTNFYDWGKWVNGGAWIETKYGKLDFIYKNIEQLIATISDSKNGKWENDFEQKPPYGFSSITYLAETKNCIVLYDKSGILKSLKEKVEVYPNKLKKTIITESIRSVEFTISHAELFFNENNMYHTTGCLTRAIKSILNIIFAINETYPINDKSAIKTIQMKEKCPKNLNLKINNILSLKIGEGMQNIQYLKELFKETISFLE
ncbi:nucleotidyltransferase domain-containing protein [Winogradskyella jejuensis]|uniref:Nucleotidyltransferase domain-containing protein n=1 Tax=Winogradskyella jejuensis TaxID=1089305 RepID=A0A1M5VRF6_9FLAO|nr:nucleotidyltransferase domain-containing protein [Winogradskyella jejuensis]SHH77839.1 protein of unknown function [Winogradskyella jejuensis]